jgi:TolB-like protein/Flp pilus assembly protein TadD
MSLKRIIREVHRRSLWQVLLIYLGASWAVLQVIDQVQTRLSMPEWVYGAAIVLLLIGLPIVLATAFVQEGGPRGDAPASEPGAALPVRVFTWRNAIIGGVVAFILLGGALIIWQRFAPSTARGDDGAKRSIAVLPFANLSPDSGDAFFAAGIHDEILTHLSQIAALDVRSRTSVLEYQETRKNLKQIARELGVRFILEGSVRRSGEQTRITAQLIDAETDAHLWADTYDGTRADVFGIQTEVAENIARALAAKLSPDEQARLNARPTANSDAYDMYLRALEYANRSYRRADMERAIRLLDGAIALDSSFAAAYALLSDVLSQTYWFYYDRSAALKQRAERTARRALQLNRDLPAAHHAIGLFHYRVHLDYDAALAEMRRAQQGAPSDAQIPFDIGAVLRRKGDMEGAISTFMRSQKLDPLNSVVIFNVAETHMLLRRYDEAEKLLLRAAELSPDWMDPPMRLARLHAEQIGDLKEARRLLAPHANAAPSETQSSPVYVGANIEYLDRQPDAALAILLRSSEEVFENQFFFRPRTLVIAQVYALKADATRARVYYDTALATIEARLRSAPDDARLHAVRGIILTGLGRKSEAIQAGKRATALMPVEKEAWRGAFLLHELARTYAATGEIEPAVEALERLLKIPSELSPAFLRNDPAFDPLRAQPRFQALLASPQ